MEKKDVHNQPPHHIQLTLNLTLANAILNFETIGWKNSIL